MGKRKQSKPHRSGELVIQSHGSTGPELDDKVKAPEIARAEKDEFVDAVKPYFVEVGMRSWLLHEHLDISELILTDLNLREGFSGFELNGDFYEDSKYSLRFQVCNVNDFINRIKLGHWPVISASDISLEFVKKCMTEAEETQSVILSGRFDGPDDGVSGLVHLASLEFLSLRPVLGAVFSKEMLSLRVRVEILKNAFDSCESLLENNRQLWKKSMVNVMSWLRPEVVTSEARYGGSWSAKIEVDLSEEMRAGISNSRKHVRFDVAGFYEAIKPSKVDPMLKDELPDLLPVLRPYQRRAAYWMLQREKGYPGSFGERERDWTVSPLCLPIEFLESCSKMFYNPFSGNVSLCPENSLSCIRGGILADEMGLGKTIELLALIFAHRKSAHEEDISMDNELQCNGELKLGIKRLKRERVECTCGAVSESRKYKGIWVQCDICDAWQHADCVGYKPTQKNRKAVDVFNEKGCEAEPKKQTRKKNTTTIVVREGEYVCQLCSELIKATDSPVASGATLIVCPAPILAQWHAEIIRHTRPGSLKTCIYEGVRSTSLLNTSPMDISELVSADIVLTTYDVLKEDLSHDSDRHEGDRHFLRFQKRYQILPTFLSRIYWWRVCLDEAQMVESNAAGATEMALRLDANHRWCITGTPIQRKLDDLYGLLRFLKASPFNVSRWWTEVIKNPYERRDHGTMEFTHKFFKQLMWRSSKRHVSDELQLPPQEECLTSLTFSPIEEHFYEIQHETCVDYAREVIENMKDANFKRQVPEAAKLLNSLLKLRQACCHPQVGSSGLRSLQQAPMTMEEILMVLVGKTKIEGEEALRRSIVALNALAGIAMIEDKISEAVSLYEEALSLSEEHSEDFRLDPLLNIHIHHNLAEILPMISNCTPQPPLNQQPGISEKAEKRHIVDDFNLKAIKRRKVSGEDDSNLTVFTGNLPNYSSLYENGVNDSQKPEDGWHTSAGSFNDKPLQMACETMKQKFLSVFSSKLYAAQQEFTKMHTLVCNELNDRKTQHSLWWLETLDHADQNKDFAGELIKKIEEAISETLNNSKSSRITSRFRSITGLKYHIQNGLDILEASRKTLLDRLLKIDMTMEKPKQEDIERVRYCRYCQVMGDGPTCVHCELEELFKDYEARLFRLNKLHGEMITSAEEAIDLQKKNSALNRFYWKLSQANKISTSSSVEDEELKKRDVGERVMVSKSASELEIVLGVIKNHCKGLLGKEGISAATREMHILESMRKEYGHARSLATAQAQVLRAHDELLMATSRLHLRENENDNAIDALSPDELASASVLQTTEKFMSSALLSRIKGKLRYLKGLVQSKQKLPSGSFVNSSSTQKMASPSTCIEVKNGSVAEANEETCPICQEKLSIQKMVFQCGHATCCKCLFAMSERKTQNDKMQSKWIMCPTCRQHSDFGNIAYADDRQNESCDCGMLHTIQGCEKCEASIIVQGSYGTKIEAVTRRILGIKSADPESKVLVFSSWNDVLDVLEHAFAANGITYIRMKGGRKSHLAISEFKGQKISGKRTRKRQDEQSEPKSIQVLLLLIQHGANGLNLLEAQHVVLVEPLLNPAAEAQAIGRVHRIGQENRTLVHRFIVKNTVEESIYKLNRSRNTNLFVSGNTKNQDQPFLTLNDVESLFAARPSPEPETKEKPAESLRHLPPSAAAAIAAERRMKEHTANSSSG
ncbi:E3 ubiquitin-protein ligase SHPRH isoform X2 [Tripterygium wilfordii]|uniref:E3 ubiquitin-protein ligase SHPRH isoform X2 n=1 Tax=Tripterygium wilfordii TaxID=458696 RepID=UPI0018F81262|nr:E3 ubiquitin-protein ligase SHPRH isoform X2 [Tripterygium wilfordii]